MDIKSSFLITSLAGFSTLLGSLFLFINKGNKDKIISNSLSFSAGVMICVSFLDLIPESISLINNIYNNFISIIIFGIFFCIGVLTSMIIDKNMPETNNGNLYKLGLISMIAIIVHNIPEGIATFMANGINTKLAISFAIAIAMHNIPEGISIAIPIYYSTNKKSKAIFFTLISALSEPLGALIAFIFLKNFINDFFIGLLFSFIAGIMMHISFYEMLSEVKKYKYKLQNSIYFIIGVGFMCLNILLF